MDTNAATGECREALPVVDGGENIPHSQTDSSVSADLKKLNSAQSGVTELEQDLYGFALILFGVAVLCQMKHLWEMLIGKEGATWSEPGVLMSVFLAACCGFCGGCVTGGRFIFRVYWKGA